jgi:hypothetical protein
MRCFVQVVGQVAEEISEEPGRSLLEERIFVTPQCPFSSLFL